jgi:hypothetical protein
MSEPCEHQRDEAAWIWQAQLDLIKAERDAAQAKVNRLRTLLGGDLGRGWTLDLADIAEDVEPDRPLLAMWLRAAAASLARP